MYEMVERVGHPLSEVWSWWGGQDPGFETVACTGRPMLSLIEITNLYTTYLI